MKYNIIYDKKALKDLLNFSKIEQIKILEKIEKMSNNLQGDIKKLTNYTPEYRLRVGNYRVLFEIENDTLTIYKIKHRKNSY